MDTVMPFGEAPPASALLKCAVAQLHVCAHSGADRASAAGRRGAHEAKARASLGQPTLPVTGRMCQQSPELARLMLILALDERPSSCRWEAVEQGSTEARHANWEGAHTGHGAQAICHADRLVRSCVAGRRYLWRHLWLEVGRCEREVEGDWRRWGGWLVYRHRCLHACSVGWTSCWQGLMCVVARNTPLRPHGRPAQAALQVH